jgi:hypothetical protein
MISLRLIGFASLFGFVLYMMARRLSAQLAEWDAEAEWEAELEKYLHLRR